MSANCCASVIEFLRDDDALLNGNVVDDFSDGNFLGVYLGLTVIYVQHQASRRQREREREIQKAYER